MKLDRKRRTRSVRKVGGRGETSHVTLKWKGGYRGGRAKRKEGDGEKKRNTTQFFTSQHYFFFFFFKEKHITRNLSSFSLVPPLCLSYSFPSI